MNSPAPHPTHRRRPLLGLAALGAVMALAPAAAAAAATRPAVKTTGAGAVTFQSANLSGTVSPGGQPTTYFFQYGPTARYGLQSLPASVAAGTGAVVVRSAIAGLVPLTRYHFRLVAVNGVGTGVGTDVVFTTAAIPLSLAIAALPGPVQFGSPLSVVGTLTGTGAAGRSVVLQQRPFPFTTDFQNLGNPELTTNTGAFQFNLLSLPITTQFRVVSVGAGHAVLSSVVTENVGLAVTLHVQSRHTRRGYYRVRFAGLIAPAEAGDRVVIQRLVGSRWRFVAATNSRSSTGERSSYTKTLHLRRGGFYRVFAGSLEGGHVDSYSQPLLVHAGSRV